MSGRVLVTGGAGYIGSHVCKALAKAGREPVTFDNLSRGNRQAVKWGPLVEGDLGDRAALEKAFTDFAPEAVVHLAALAYVEESTRLPLLYYRNNVVGSLSLIEAATGAGSPPIVFSSTCSIYGEPETVPIPEDAPRKPVNPYGATKSAVEDLLAAASRAGGPRSVALRYFNAAGADPDGEIGECHDPETHLIPIVLECAAGARESFKVMGTDYDTPDGSCVRDFIHVADIARAHLAALDYLLGGGGTTAVNLANGQGFSVREVVAAAARITGRTIPTVTAPRRDGDPPILVGNAGKARELLGWEPVHSGLDEQIRHAWNWYRGGFEDWTSS